MMGGAATAATGAKKCVAPNRSERKSALAASSMEKMRRLKTALMNQAQTVIGIRGKVMPFVRRSMVVTTKLRAFNVAATQNTRTEASHSVRPVSGAQKKAATIPTTAETGSQNPRRVSRGNAISLAPICVGKKYVPNPACGAQVRTTKTMSEPWTSVSEAYASGEAVK